MSAPQDPQGQQPGYPYQGGHPEQGGYPAGTAPYEDPGRQVKLPGVLVVSVVLWVLTGLFLLFVGFGSVSAGGSAAAREQLSRAADMLAGYGLQVDPAMLERALVVSGIVLLTLGALLVILSLLMLMAQGWARVLLTIVGIIALLPLLTTLVGPLVVLVAIVLHFVPPVNRWFRFRAGTL
ncbi:MAG: hypothetical protein GEV09_05755 [Pseudonocardiaceae bacterium]|nr:hypothetical protein [Pseudonocardiaceae bacterium]